MHVIVSLLLHRVERSRYRSLGFLFVNETRVRREYREHYKVIPLAVRCLSRVRCSIYSLYSGAVMFKSAPINAAANHRSGSLSFTLDIVTKISSLRSLSRISVISPKVAHSHPKRGYFPRGILRYRSPIFPARVAIHGLCPFDLPFSSLASRRCWVVENVPIIQTEALIDGDCGRPRREVCNVRFSRAGNGRTKEREDSQKWWEDQMRDTQDGIRERKGGKGGS